MSSEKDLEGSFWDVWFSLVVWEWAKGSFVGRGSRETEFYKTLGRGGREWAAGRVAAHRHSPIHPQWWPCQGGGTADHTSFLIYVCITWFLPGISVIYTIRNTIAKLFSLHEENGCMLSTSEEKAKGLKSNLIYIKRQNIVKEIWKRKEKAKLC